MNTILKYFPDITEEQRRQFEALADLYTSWNSKINVISRKDIDNLYSHHVLHSLSIARFVKWKPGTRILDFGTGGGFPGIPLAIMFPDCQFKMIDGTAKKIRVVNEVATAIGLKNVEAVQLRGEEEHAKFHFVVSRAVMQLPDLMKIVRKNVSKEQQNALPNGVICLKGGNVNEEGKAFRNVMQTAEISQWFDDEWFKEKYLVYIPV